MIIMGLPGLSTIAARPVVSAVVVLVATLFSQFVARLVKHRLYFRRLQAQGMPMLPHSFLFGHLPVLIKTTKMFPGDANMFYLTTFIMNTYPDLGPEYYLDLFPMAPSILVLGSPDTINQATIKYVLPKNIFLKDFLRPLTDALDIVSLNGAPWKKWRTIFNPGFSAAHITSLAPIIVEEVEIFCGHLDKHVDNQDVVQIKPLADNLILDIVGQVILDVNFNAQRSFSQFAYSLRTQIKWLTIGAGTELIHWYNPVRMFVQWHHGRIVNTYINNALDKRIEAWQQDPADFKRSRTIMDLTLKAYTEIETGSASTVMDEEFKKSCSAQIKIFLFAGHDTTASAICFTLWLLTQNPDKLRQLRKEHNEVLGSDPSKAAEIITESPHIVNQLLYTTAVLKESLRLFPPSTGTRAGETGVSIIDSEGRALPTDDIVVWSNQHSAHRNPKYWPQPGGFLPERWLVGPEDPLYPVKGMWRPFEQGPRNCLGQELATLEIKIALVLLSRTYMFKPAYDEVNTMLGKKTDTVLGAEAYQMYNMHPKDGLPMRVERLERSQGLNPDGS